MVFQDDFRPILRELLATHRGLEFLQDTPEFQERYGNLYILEPGYQNMKWDMHEKEI